MTVMHRNDQHLTFYEFAYFLLMFYMSVHADQPTLLHYYIVYNE